MRLELADSKIASIFVICEKFIESFLFWRPFHYITSCTLATVPYEWCQNIDWYILRNVYFCFYSILQASLPLMKKTEHIYTTILQVAEWKTLWLTPRSEIVEFNQLTNFLECKALLYSMMNPDRKFVSQMSFITWNCQCKHLGNRPRIKTHTVSVPLWIFQDS